MKYKYRNLKHVTIYGIGPYSEKEFDHEMPTAKGAIELVEEKTTVKSVKRSKRKQGDD